MLLIKVSGWDFSKAKIALSGQFLLFFVGVMIYLLSFLLWLWIVSFTELSVSYPIAVGITAVFVFVLSVVFLNEAYELKKIFALALVCVGIYLISS